MVGAPSALDAVLVRGETQVKLSESVGGDVHNRSRQNGREVMQRVHKSREFELECSNRALAPYGVVGRLSSA